MGYKVNQVRDRMQQWLLAVVLFSTAIEADYKCLCSYQNVTGILEQPTNTSKVNGYMYTTDCRAYFDIPGLDEAYAAVGNENKYGYIRRTSDTLIQTCLGSIPQEQHVTTTPDPTTVPATTTTTTATTTHLTDPSKHTNHHTPLPASTATRTTTIQRPTLIFTTTKISTTFTSTKTTPTITLATSTMRTITTLAADITTTPISTTTKTEYLSNQAYCTSLLRTSNTRYVTNNGIFCYEYVNRSVSWEAARNDCRNRSGNLLEIESGATNDFIYNFIGNIQYLHPIWIGLHDQINEEAWMWDTGIPLTKTKYTNWVPSRYVDQYHATEDCCVFLWNRLGQWDDVDCDGRSYNEFTSKAYICQFKIPATP
ncbi:aggrecan core protein-like isoform X6 [Dreissena polymorpha]|uniref:aggrecan core protein-like isoform X6 n=1 Tax=Dreissena polymorpha TaxID=45954 RepID=UPI0022645580|nr:aggrecan core protein-like isoform X6 [Dreissena polymorpha]